VRDHNVQPIGGASLKDDDQTLVAEAATLDRAEGSAGEKAGHRRRADYGKSAVAKKDSTSRHEKSLLASGLAA
jgi:hypothetical protein